MSFVEFVRSRGFTMKSLADKAGVSVRSLDCYTRKTKRYKWKKARLSVALSVSGALGIPAEKLLEFDEIDVGDDKD